MNTPKRPLFTKSKVSALSARTWFTPYLLQRPRLPRFHHVYQLLHGWHQGRFGQLHERLEPDGLPRIPNVALLHAVPRLSTQLLQKGTEELNEHLATTGALGTDPVFAMSQTSLSTLILILIYIAFF
jgi:hypothetical protein